MYCSRYYRARNLIRGQRKKTTHPRVYGNFWTTKIILVSCYKLAARFLENLTIFGRLLISFTVAITVCITAPPHLVPM